MTWEQEQKLIGDAAAQFPAEFGLRAFPGQRFAIRRASCYVCDGQVYLYTAVRKLVTHKGGAVNAEWFDFAKGTPAELLAEITEVK